MNYQETIDFLYQQLPIFQREGASAYRADLGNIVQLSDYLGQPHQAFRSIHIAGTNGKGSTSHILTSIGMESGLKVGTYTSPHYLNFRERIRVNGEYITEDAVVEFVEEVQPLIEEIKPSFFELTVAMAFWYFRQQGVDLAIIEVGLGGRLDSTNIITPILSIITNIGLDHQQFLGKTNELIAVEKAGIIKTNVPVVIGKTQSETEQIFRRIAEEKQASILFADQEFTVHSLAKNFEYQQFMIQSTTSNVSFLVKTDLLGDYQQENIRTAFCAFQLIKDQLNWTDRDFLMGVLHVQDNTKVFGRWQILQQNPTVIADSGHNEDGISEIFQELKQLDYDELFLIYGVADDKDLESLVGLFPKDANIMLTQASVPRAMKVDKLAKSFESFPNVRKQSVPSLAYKEVLTDAGSDDLILIFGSIFLVADVLESL